MKLASQTRFSADEKRVVLLLVGTTQSRTGWTLRRILKQLGLSKGRYHEWRKRASAEEGRLADRSTAVSCRHALLPEEKAAVIRYALEHPKDGYRRLAWQMVDADVAYVSPSSVYRTLSDADLLYRWKRSTSSGAAPAAPTQPNQRWHTDIMYLRIEDSWYFLVTLIDGYSRYVVHWDLLTSMTAAEVRLVIQEALERTGARPQIVSDNGTQFTAADFKHLVRQFELDHIRIRTYHPESNGVIERFHRSTREALAESDLVNLARARELIGRWVEHYNGERLQRPCTTWRQLCIIAVIRKADFRSAMLSWCRRASVARNVTFKSHAQHERRHGVSEAAQDDRVQQQDAARLRRFGSPCWSGDDQTGKV